MTEERAIFRDPELEKNFETAGFAATDPIVEEGEIQALIALHRSHEPQNGSGFTFLVSKRRYEVSHEIMDRLRPAIQPHLSNYRLLHGNFVTKHPGDESVLPPHVDPTLVDEDHLQSVVIWVPLQDVDESNGCLWVLRGSHRTLRWRVFPPEHMIAPAMRIYEEFSSDLRQPIPVKAGSVVVFHPGLVHWSGANGSTVIRRAVQVYAVPQEADVIRCQLTDDGRVARHRAADDFMLDYHSRAFKKLGPLIDVRDLGPVDVNYGIRPTARRGYRDRVKRLLLGNRA